MVRHASLWILRAVDGVVGMVTELDGGISGEYSLALKNRQRAPQEHTKSAPRELKEGQLSQRRQVGRWHQAYKYTASSWADGC